jgi:hypothetical protein
MAPKKGNVRKGRLPGSRLAYDDTRQEKRKLARKKRSTKNVTGKNKRGGDTLKRDQGVGRTDASGKRRKKRKDPRKEKGTETIKLRKKKGAKENANITFKKGALHRHLKFSGTFTKAGLARLKKVENGKSFTFKGNKFKMTPLLKREITLGLTMMGWKK